VIKSELIQALKDKLPELQTKDVELAVNYTLRQMTDTLAQGERIEISWGVAIFAKDFWVSYSKISKNYATTMPLAAPGRSGHSFTTKQGVTHMLSNDSTQYRIACIFTTQKDASENTYTIASGGLLDFCLVAYANKQFINNGSNSLL